MGMITICDICINFEVLIASNSNIAPGLRNNCVSKVQKYLRLFYSPLHAETAVPNVSLKFDFHNRTTLQF